MTTGKGRSESDLMMMIRTFNDKSTYGKTTNVYQKMPDLQSRYLSMGICAALPRSRPGWIGSRTIRPVWAVLVYHHPAADDADKTSERREHEIRDNMTNPKYTKAREIALVIWMIAGAANDYREGKIRIRFDNEDN